MKTRVRWPVLLAGNPEGVMLKAENVTRAHLETLDLLLDAKADVNRSNLQWGEGRRVLHQARKCCFRAVFGVE